LNTHNDADNSKDDEEYNEADPSLFTGSPCRANGLVRIAKTKDMISSGSIQAVKGLSPSLYVLLGFASLSLDDIDGLILLFNQYAHLVFKIVIRRVILKVSEETDVIKQLRELGNSPLDTLDILMTFLYFTVSGARLAVPVRAHKLIKRSEHTHTKSKQQNSQLERIFVRLDRPQRQHVLLLVSHQA